MLNAKFQEIERASLFISLFSRLDETTGSFINSPYILGGSGYFTDEAAKDSVEQAFGQLNLPDLFQQFDFVLNIAFYLPIKLKMDLKIVPNIYSIKTKYKNIYSMYLILTPYSDINVTSLNNDLSEIVEDYAGTALRIDDQDSIATNKPKNLYIESIDPELEEASVLLLRRIYYRLFLDRSLAGGTEQPSKPANLVAVMIQNATIYIGYYCMNCHKTFAKKNVRQEQCPNCGNKLNHAPPVMEIDSVSYLFPQELRSGIIDPETRIKTPYHSPIDLRYLFQASHLPLDISLTYYRIDSDLFQNILPLPTKSIFNYRTSDDIIVLYSQHRELPFERYNDKKMQIITGISDSRVTGEEFMSDMAMRLVVRDLEEGFKKGYDLDRIFKCSILKTWLQSPEYEMKKESVPPQLLNWKNIEGRKQLD